MKNNTIDHDIGIEAVRYCYPNSKHRSQSHHHADTKIERLKHPEVDPGMSAHHPLVDQGMLAYQSLLKI